jgi:hypothetical protein
MKTAETFNQSRKALHSRLQQLLRLKPVAQIGQHYVKNIAADLAVLSKHHRFVYVNQPSPDHTAQGKNQYK